MGSVEPGAYRNEVLAILRTFSVIAVFGFGFYLGQAWKERPCSDTETAVLSQKRAAHTLEAPRRLRGERRELGLN